MAVEIVVENFNEFVNQLDLKSEQGQKVMRSTMYDIRRRAPGWVAKEVAKFYNVSVGEIKSGGKLGSVSITGSDDGIEMRWKGRHLTPQHFDQKPGSGSNSDYTTQMTVHKGSTVTIGEHKKKKVRGGPHSKKSGNFPMLNGQTLVAQRVSKNRMDLEVFYTTSLPQMVLNDQLTTEPVARVLDEKCTERLMHNLERFF